jgi:ribonuclease Z
MFITVLGSSGCRYDHGNDTASFLINNKIIVDTGWNLVENILDMGLNPTDFKTVLFTHFHHDHYIGLPQFLFYHICSGKSLDEIDLFGAKDDLKLVVNLAMEFLQMPRFYKDMPNPNCIELDHSEKIMLRDIDIKTHKSIHPVDGRFYRVTDKATGKITGFAGDTACDPDESEFFKGCDLLIHECSLGGKYSGGNPYLHASAEDAAAVAEAAGVKKLALVHYPEKRREECRSAAAGKFSGEILTPVKGEVIHV